MIFCELSNAVFRFVLRCAGAEIDGEGGGVFKHTPPSRWWKIQRPIRARVNVMFTYLVVPFYCIIGSSVLL